MPSKKPVRNVHGQHRRAIIKLLEAISSSAGRRLREVFADFVEISALTIANRVVRSQETCDAREARYLKIIGKYERKNVDRFAETLAQFVLATEIEGGDVLGECFMGSNLGSTDAGQFFTPIEVARLMAGLGDLPGLAKEKQAAGEIVMIAEPCIGAGAMSIAAFEMLREGGIDYRQLVHLTTVDVDPQCVQMAFLQLSIREIPAIVIHGNALSLEEWDRWYTPAHSLYGWDKRLGGVPTVKSVRKAIEERAGEQLNLLSALDERAS